MNNLSPRRTPANCRSRLGRLAVLAMVFSCQAAMAVGPYSYNALGNEVTDTATGLVWQRCSAGQLWADGSCAGTATTYTHEAALAYAAGQAGWRLPNVKELASLVDSSRGNPAINIVAFPNTVNGVYWSSSPYAGNSSSAWVVGFDYGGMNYHNRTWRSYVRLVR